MFIATMVTRMQLEPRQGRRVAPGGAQGEGAATLVYKHFVPGGTRAEAVTGAPSAEMRVQLSALSCGSLETET